MAEYNQLLNNVYSGDASNLPPEAQNALTAVGIRNPDHDVIAWWKIPEEVQSQVLCKRLCPFLVMPCFFPCAIGACVAMQSTLESQLVILTRTKLIKQQETVICCYKGGLDVQSYALKDILSVISDRKGTACFNAQTVVMLPGVFGNHDHIRQNMMLIPCREEEVDQITRMISEAKEAAENMRMGAAVYGAPVAAGPRSQETKGNHEKGADLYGTAATSAPVGTGPGLAGELERLSTLWKQGALTDDEFQEAKKQLMRGPM